MNAVVTDITGKALALPVNERAMLAPKLWDSLGNFHNPSAEKDWYELAERRWKEIEEGKVNCIPAREVMKQARNIIAQKEGR